MTTVLLQASSANAATVPKVAQPVMKENWYAASFKVTWKAVSGAIYQVRWANNSKMRYSKSKRVTTRTTSVGPLNRTKVWYVQVRAIRSGKVGPWSLSQHARFHNRWPATSTATRSTIPGGVKVSWTYAPYATNYTAKFTAATADRWPATTHATKFGITSRSATRMVPTDAASDETMTAVPYGNPVFMQVTTTSVYQPKASLDSKWVLAWPGFPTPAAGTPVGFGTYNVMFGGDRQDDASPAHQSWDSRRERIASNIFKRGLDLVALQEIALNDDRMSDGADDLVAMLGNKTGHTWEKAIHQTSYVGGRIIFDTTAFRLDEDHVATPPSGLLDDYSTISDVPGKVMNFPYVVLRSQANDRGLMVVSAHVTVPAGATLPQQYKSTATTARQIVAAVNKVQDLRGTNYPVVVAGDFTTQSITYGAMSAHPQFVHLGYWNSLASTHRVNVAYPSVLALAKGKELPFKAGFAGVPDAIFLKGIHGTSHYENVVNYPSGTTRPSDHNLVYTRFNLPAQ